MTVIEFIFGVVILIFVFITIIGIFGIKYDYVRLTEENEELKAKLQRKLKREIKKTNKIVKEDKK